MRIRSLLVSVSFLALACGSESSSNNGEPGGATFDGTGGGMGTTGGAGPGVGGAIPGAGGAIPGAGGAVPGSGGAVPGSGGAVPGSGGAIPGSGGAIPGSGGAIPGSGGAVPGAGGAVPGAGGTAPGAGGTAPGAGGTAPGAGGNGVGGDIVGSGGDGVGGDIVGSGGNGVGGDVVGTGGDGGFAGDVGTGGEGTGGEGTGGASTTDITVQTTDVRQIIRGFGINSALMPGGVSFPVNEMFSTNGTNGIGFSILRVGMNSDGSLTGGYVSEARAQGARIIGSTWSPPGNCKSDGTTDNGGYLLESCYESWSDTIANFAQQQNLYAMSIANESDFASCPGNPVCTDAYDTTTYTANQMVAWVKVAGPKLRNVGVLVIAPEASEWIHAWSNASGTGSLVASHPDSSDPLGCGCFSNTPTEAGCAQTCLDGNGYDYGHWLWADQTAWDSFDIFGVHEYDSQMAYAWPADVNGGVRDKEVWQTEMSGVMHWPEQGPSTDINNGVAVARWIHSALTVGEASAWLYWWYEAYYQNDNEGLALIQGSSTIAKRYYTMGQFSKFMRPDQHVVGITGDIPQDIMLVASVGDDGTVVVVGVNESGSSQDLPITIAGGTAPTGMDVWRTDSGDNIASQAAVTVTGGTFTASLPAMSVTTFVSQ